MRDRGCGHALPEAHAKERAFVRVDLRVDPGEEFALILPETPMEGAVNLAEMLRGKVAESPYLFADQPISVTVSLGISQLADDRWTTSDFIQAADDKLYAAKRNGRNRVEQ